jgi:hypothetical protein
MSRYPFASFTFLTVLITFLAIRQSVIVFGPGAAAHVAPGREQIHERPWNGPYFLRASVAMELGRAAELVDDAWRRAILFEEWRMEYTAAQWDLFRASTRTESDLIDARFHVANAEVFTDAMHQNERAIKELVRADLLLQDAESAAQDFMMDRLHSVRAEIKAVEAKEQTEDGPSTVRFETLKQDIDRLIDGLHASAAGTFSG